MRHLFARFFAFLALVSLLGACGTTPVAQPTTPTPVTAPLKVVATYSILGEFVQHVGGEHVALTTLVGPGGDAHTYEPTPRDSAALAEASLVFENGLQFESWIDDLYTAAGSHATRVAVSDQITPLPAPEGHVHTDHADDPLAHPCKHFGDTPTSVVADASATAVIPDDHTLYALELNAGAGTVTLSRDTDAEVSLYLGADLPVSLLQGETTLEPEAMQQVTSGCDAIKVVYTYDLAPGAYTLQVGPSDATQLLLVWEMAEGHTHTEDAHAEDTHNHGEYDPHIWHDPNNAQLMVAAIRDALVAADPANAAAYTANAESYLAELKELDAFIQAEVAKLPADQRKLVTTHDTFGYFAKAYGFTVIGTALGVTTETADPSAGEIAELVEAIRAAGVRAIFAENVANTTLMETISREAGVILAPTLYTDALGEPGSPGASYIEMMRYNVTTIVQSLAS
ncbi:metal ABC transporter solute-binding protein, Zn/Mn family [Candidatus Oscillochloris fontis]|uniref:metal ABC transporter solute-binding protein, Zn/Mn family n=1 Tax=Candidatus Oscillochloris fontis TaxID=2496868 RepID=UPI00101BCF45|nr:zinc ABC transporter substrate-binding protein [Candidatus Oscillochloris fontis]